MTTKFHCALSFAVLSYNFGLGSEVAEIFMFSCEDRINFLLSHESYYDSGDNAGDKKILMGTSTI
jgi:hypothetical protein